MCKNGQNPYFLRAAPMWLGGEKWDILFSSTDLDFIESPALPAGAFWRAICDIVDLVFGRLPEKSSLLRGASDPLLIKSFIPVWSRLSRRIHGSPWSGPEAAYGHATQTFWPREKQVNISSSRGSSWAFSLAQTLGWHVRARECGGSK